MSGRLCLCTSGMSDASWKSCVWTFALRTETAYLMNDWSSAPVVLGSENMLDMHSDSA